MMARKKTWMIKHIFLGAEVANRLSAKKKKKGNLRSQ